MADPFVLALAKIDRAEARLEELKQEIGRHYGGDTHQIPGEYDPEKHVFTFFFQPRTELPPSIDLIIGEIAHGLRSALNNLVATLSGTPNADGDFPIFVNEIDYRASGLRKISRMTTADQNFVTALQPYHSPDPDDTPLAILNRLARIDKHRDGTFSVIAEVYGNFDFFGRMDVSGYGKVEMFAGVMEPGDPLAKVEVIPSGPNPELDIKVDFSAGIAFGKRWVLPDPFPRLITEVRRVVAGFAAMR
jgi:hypothetical protein